MLFVVKRLSLYSISVNRINKIASVKPDIMNDDEQMYRLLNRNLEISITKNLSSGSFINLHPKYVQTWWRHQMEIFFRITGPFAGNSPVTGGESTGDRWIPLTKGQ